MTEYYTFDDVQILPRFSNNIHRDNVDISSRLTKNINIDIPIVSSPMETITGLDMALALSDVGGVGVFHRFTDVDTVRGWIVDFKNLKPDKVVGASVGTHDYDSAARDYVEAGVDFLLVDVAHGHHVNVANTIKSLVSYGVDIIAGNIATPGAAVDLIGWGVSGLRVGIGGGSVCTTRIKTGVGVPMITCIEKIYEAVKYLDVPIIADGGIRNAGDVCKALAAGADTVMLGSLLAGTKETPSPLIRDGEYPNEKLYKEYIGSASSASKGARGEADRYVEGIQTKVPYKGRVNRITNFIVDGIKSSMSYVGSDTLSSFRNNVEFIKVTPNGVREAATHIIK